MKESELKHVNNLIWVLVWLSNGGDEAELITSLLEILVFSYET